jgi:REP element-mobilizing transposase RayT
MFKLKSISSSLSKKKGFILIAIILISIKVMQLLKNPRASEILEMKINLFDHKSTKIMEAEKSSNHLKVLIITRKMQPSSTTGNLTGSTEMILFARISRMINKTIKPSMVKRMLIEFFKTDLSTGATRAIQTKLLLIKGKIKSQ